jgi:cell division protein FtsI/penicillin-binding protein 2
LVKPFTALAYGEQNGYRYPIHFCKGKASGCWLAKGHGRVDIISAISKSCNSYFRALAASMTGEQVDSIATRFGIDEPDRDLTGPALIGLGTDWQISPLHMARAYLELTHMRDQPGVHELLEGMEQSAREGTGAGVGRALRNVSALVKTGTAPCTHANPAPGDGFVVALVPANEPELLLMIRVHGVPGAKASITAGLMLKSIEE